MEAIGFWPRGNEPCGRRRSGFGSPNGRILLFKSMSCGNTSHVYIDGEVGHRTGK
jgi:hypothetical protein